MLAVLGVMAVFIHSAASGPVERNELVMRLLTKLTEKRQASGPVERNELVLRLLTKLTEKRQACINTWGELMCAQFTLAECNTQDAFGIGDALRASCAQTCGQC